MNLVQREILQTLSSTTQSLTAAAITQHIGGRLATLEEALDELESQRLIMAVRSPRLGSASRAVYSITTAGRAALEAEPPL